MKSVLISIQPKWVEKIASGEKTIEVRKTRPKIETSFKCYIYCTYGKASENYMLGKRGKVIGEFVCDSIEMVKAKCSDYGIDLFYHDCMAQGCLTEREIEKYFNIPEDKDLRVMKGNGYAWHISDLKIYKEPKDLSEFYSTKWDMPCENKKRYFNMDFCMAYENGSHFCKECICDKKRLIRPPQNWCYVESLGE